MYCSVQYVQDGVKSERKYMYKTELPLNPNDRVWAPTYKGDAKAVVAEINLDEPKFPCKEICMMREDG